MFNDLSIHHDILLNDWPEQQLFSWNCSSGFSEVANLYCYFAIKLSPFGETCGLYLMLGAKCGSRDWNKCETLKTYRMAKGNRH